MNTLIYDRYGPPDVVRLGALAWRSPAENGAALISTVDRCRIRNARSGRFFGRFLGPTPSDGIRAAHAAAAR